MVWFSYAGILLATYSSGAYGAESYNGETAAPLVQLGPLSLPNTGAGWLVLASALLLGVSVGLAMWLWQRRRRAV